MEIGLIALPTSSICNPAQKSSGQIKINNLPLECRAKAPADRGKGVNGGGVTSKMMCRCAAMAGAQGMTEWERCAARIFRWFYFTQRTFFAGFYPLALKKYTLFFYLRVVYA